MDERSNWRNSVVRIILHVEGGGERNIQKRIARRGFRLFLEKAGLKGRMPRIMACGSRDDAYRDFRSSHKAGHVTAVLLVDSEEQVTASTAWDHLQSRERSWRRPTNSQDAQFHLMVQFMESWFLADRDALIGFYGRNFRTKALPKRPEIEAIPKQDVTSGLENATRATTKGKYDKGSHSFEILGLLDPDKVQRSSPHAKRFVDTLKRLSASS